MKRSAPLKAKGASLSRTRGLRRMSDKRRAELEDRRRVREAVLERDRTCVLAQRLRDRPDLPIHTCRGPLTYHHLWKEGQGGPYTEDNGVALCLEANAGWVESWPLEAKVLGLVR